MIISRSFYSDHSFISAGSVVANKGKERPQLLQTDMANVLFKSNRNQSHIDIKKNGKTKGIMEVGYNIAIKVYISK